MWKTSWVQSKHAMIVDHNLLGTASGFFLKNKILWTAQSIGRPEGKSVSYLVLGTEAKTCTTFSARFPKIYIWPTKEPQIRPFALEATLWLSFCLPYPWLTMILVLWGPCSPFFVSFRWRKTKSWCKTICGEFWRGAKMSRAVSGLFSLLVASPSPPSLLTWVKWIATLPLAQCQHWTCRSWILLVLSWVSLFGHGLWFLGHMPSPRL